MAFLKRRHALGLLAGAVVAPGLAMAEPIELSFWTFLPAQGTDPRSKVLHDVIESFNTSQQQYRVVVQSIDYARIDNTVIQATAAGRGPDILNVNSDLLPMHASAGTIIPLDSQVALMTEASRKDFVLPLDFLTLDGHVMAIPWETRVWLLWYRQDLLSKAGLSLPKTLDELGATAGKLSDDHMMGFVMGASTGQLGAGVIETFTPLLWAAGGRLLTPDGKAAFNSDAGVRTLTFLRDLVTRDHAMRDTVVTMTADDVLSSIKAGTAASTIQGSFRVSAARNAAATGDNLKTAPIPGWTADAPAPARLAAQTLTIGASSKQQAGAWAFINHYIGRPVQLAFVQAGVMPSRRSTYDDAYFRDDPRGRELLGWSNYARDYGRLELMPPDYAKLTKSLAEAVQEVLLRGTDPRAALNDAAGRYQS